MNQFVRLLCISVVATTLLPVVAICEALARHGHLDEALKVAENEQDYETRFTLEAKTALAAAKAARIDDAEQAVRQVMASNEKYTGEGVWCELAKALYKQGEMESARNYAVRVTDKYTIRTNRDLRRIMSGVPPDTPYVSKSQSKESGARNSVALQTDDPDEAKRMVETAIVNAEKQPIEATTGQFGPWNQTAQLAKLRLGYAYVAALYRQAGNQDEATKATEIANQAIQTIVKESGFVAMLLLGDLYRMQIAMDDIDGLKHSTAATDARAWLGWTDPIVSKVLSSGDVGGAEKIARQALSAKTGLDNLFVSDQSEVISCFIEVGETQAAHDLVKTSEPVDIVEARTQAEVEQIEAKSRAETTRLDAQADAEARRLREQAEAEATAAKVEAETQAYEQRAKAAEVLEGHPALLRLAELETLRDLAKNAVLPVTTFWSF